jgi:beta-glucosidase-like glycosyl hydrolase
MKKVRQYLFIGLLLVLTVLLGFNYFYRPFEIVVDLSLSEDSQMGEEAEAEFSDLNFENMTPESVLEQLTPMEKVAQILALPVVINTNIEINIETDIFSTDQVSPDLFLTDVVPGFYTIFGSEISQEEAKKTIDDLLLNSSDHLVRPFIAVDHEGGSVQRLSGAGFDIIPSFRNVCAIKSPTERELIWLKSAQSLAEVGINIVLGPMLDVGTSRALGSRTCSVDSYAVTADRAIEYIESFANRGILSVVKHFPGIGSVQTDLHNNFATTQVLDNDVKIYKFVIEQVEKIGVMVSHAGVTSQFADIPCSLSPDCVGELKAAYPQVLIFTDALEMNSARYDRASLNLKDLATVSKEAIFAGNEVLIYGPSVNKDDLEEVALVLVDEYESNPEFKELVDLAVLKVVRYKQ